MADVLVSPLVELLRSNLTSLIRNEFRSLYGVKKDLEKLSSTLGTVRSVLDDAETKQIKDKPIGDWLRKLKDAAYEAENTMDDCALEFQRTELREASNSLSTCFDFTHLVFRHKVGIRIKELREKFDEIAAERLKFHLSSGLKEDGGTELGPDRETSSKLTEPIVYGRDEDREIIVKIMLDNVKSQSNLSICPILGIGGLGKTTLAQLIYNDVRVVDQFNTRIWICVSDDFSLKRVAKMIIEFLSERGCNLAEINPMQNYLEKSCQNLQGPPTTPRLPLSILADND